MDRNMLKVIITSVILLLAVIAFLVINPFVMISAGERGVQLRWGAVQNDILTEGIHWVTPIMVHVKKLSTQVQKEQVDSSAASKDLQTVTSTIALNYHLESDKVNWVWQNLGEDFKIRIIDPAIQESFKATTSLYTAEELITKREIVKEKAKADLKSRLIKDFIIVDELSIMDFNFSKDFNDAIEHKVKAEQTALTAKNILEQKKYEAEQIVVTAKANAEAIKIQAQAITQQGGKDYVQLQAINKWNGVLPTQMIPGATVPFINLTR